MRRRSDGCRRKISLGVPIRLKPWLRLKTAPLAAPPPGEEEKEEPDVLVVDAPDARRVVEDGGVALVLWANGTMALTLSDGAGTNATASTDPACAARLAAPGEHFVGAVADVGPRLVSFMVDGVLCDGGGVWKRGWAWLPPLREPRSTGTLRVASERVLQGGVFTRSLSTSELVAQWRWSPALRAS